MSTGNWHPSIHASQQPPLRHHVTHSTFRHSTQHGHEQVHPASCVQRTLGHAGMAATHAACACANPEAPLPEAALPGPLRCAQKQHQDLPRCGRQLITVTYCLSICTWTTGHGRARPCLIAALRNAHLGGPPHVHAVACMMNCKKHTGAPATPHQATPIAAGVMCCHQGARQAYRQALSPRCPAPDAPLHALQTLRLRRSCCAHRSAS
jgi:hypothetical protein